jgi:hypothetical protein
MSNAIARPRWWDLFFWGRFWCGLALIGLGVPAFYQLGAQHRKQLAADQARDQRFEREGVAAHALVTGKSEVPYGKGAQGWWVSYSYRDAHGQSHFGFGTISKEAWDRLQAGDQLPIVYIVDDAERSRPAAEELYRAPWILVALVPLAMVACVVIGLLQIAWAIRKAGRQRLCPKCGGTGKVQISLVNNQGTISSSCSACRGQGKMGNGEAADPAVGADGGRDAGSSEFQGSRRGRRC